MEFMRKTLIVAAIAGVLGFFAGREEMKYEFANAVASAFKGIGSAFAPAAAPQAPTLSAESIAKEAAVSAAKKDAAEYAKNLKVYDFEAKYIKTFSGDRPAGVAFKIKNTGERAVKKLCVKVFYQDDAGKNVAEERFCPVLVISGSFVSENNTPLKPNYIWQQKQNNYFVNEKIPAEWKEGAATLQFDEIELEPSA
jgi:hypothetical protein